jgi:3-oxoacyl-[acyl-carrier-protein] synthase-3
MTNAFYRSRIAGTGSYLPEKILSNQDLEKMVETNDAWIVERTGIRTRHLAADNQATSDLGLIAAQRALQAADMTPLDLDLILFATVSPDQLMPSTACVLQRKLGARQVMAFDINAACSGFLYAVTVADQFIKTGFYKNILVVGAEVLHRYINYKDRETCILFGDGAGAAVLTRASDSQDCGLLSAHLHADGNLSDLLILPAGGSAMPVTHEIIDKNLQYVTMKGREIFKNAVRAMSNSCQEALDSSGTPIEKIDWMIPHQANLRIIQAVGSHFGIPAEKVIINVEKTGNTSAATIPIAFDEAVRDGRVKRGQLLMFTAFGAGLTSGALLVRY